MLCIVEEGSGQFSLVVWWQQPQPQHRQNKEVKVEMRKERRAHHNSGMSSFRWLGVLVEGDLVLDISLPNWRRRPSSGCNLSGAWGSSGCQQKSSFNGCVVASLLTRLIAVSCGGLPKKVTRTPVACLQSRVSRRAASIVELPLSVFRLGFFLRWQLGCGQQSRNFIPWETCFLPCKWQ